MNDLSGNRKGDELFIVGDLRVMETLKMDYFTIKSTELEMNGQQPPADLKISFTAFPGCRFTFFRN